MSAFAAASLDVSDSTTAGLWGLCRELAAVLGRYDAAADSRTLPYRHRQARLACCIRYNPGLSDLTNSDLLFLLLLPFFVFAFSS